MKPLSLVIIEDEEAHFSLMKRTLAKSLPNATVHYFQDPVGALEKIDDLGPDIIITDYLMPGMNGVEFLEALNRSKQDIPVIMITGQGDENIAVQAMKLGAWDYLVKSPDFFTLLPSVVEKVLREWKLRESLRKSEERFQDLSERTADWIWELDPESRYIYSSPVSEEILGYRPEEIVGRHFFDFFHDQDRKDLSVRFHEIFSSRQSVTAFEHVLVDKGGNKVIVETHAVPFFGHSGEPLGYRGVHRDITTRKRAEQALRESEEKFRSIFEESPIGIELYDSEGRLIDANKACLDIFGLRGLKDIKGLKIYDNPNIPEHAKERLLAGETLKYETSYDFDQVREKEFYKSVKKGTIYIDVLITPLGKQEKEAFAGYLFQFRDVTQRKRAEEHIRILSQQLMQAEEMERQKLSRDLHDHFAQDLSTLKIDLDTLFDDDPDAPGEKRRRIQEISKMVQGTIMSVRNLAYNLSPASLTQLGLVPIVRQCVEEFSHRNGISADFFPAGMDGIRLDFDTEIGLFRVIQEALNNIRNHAEASHVVIRLVACYPRIIVRIEDDGGGFDVRSRLEEAYSERRMGIRSMNERIALLNGELGIDSRPGHGTKIVAEVPYKERRSG